MRTAPERAPVITAAMMLGGLPGSTAGGGTVARVAVGAAVALVGAAVLVNELEGRVFTAVLVDAVLDSARLRAGFGVVEC
jgi:Trk-type K+ transport system membrane component